MKTLLAAMIITTVGTNASAIWTERASDAGVDVTHCIKPGVDSVKCIRVMKEPTPAPKKSTVKQSTAINKDDIKDGGPTMNGSSPKDIRCLAYSIYREAGNQKVVDQYAVGQVHINRLKEGSWGKTMCKVVFSKAQFSWTLESKLTAWTKKQEEHFTMLAESLMIDGFYVKRLASNRILHYHANYVNPKWARQGQKVASAGAHIFYKNVPF
jgi:spore germination cell wall hydrolase CwlJ-like protein